jgi:cytochrome c oxidase accessory protein FixG
MSAKEYLKNWTPYANKRYIMYTIVTIMSLVMPFIKINGNQIFLLSFDHKQLHLMGTAFDMQEMYMMPFLLMFMFIGIFAVTSVGGRAWCGWSCPQTIFRVIYRDLIEGKILGMRRVKNKQKDPDMSKSENKVKKIIAITIWTMLSLIAAADFIWYFIPPADFFTYLADPANHTTMYGFLIGVAGFLVYDVVWLKEDFCIYICPYSRVQSVLYDDDTYQAVYVKNRGGKIYDDEKNKIITKKSQLAESDECMTCESCVTVCPTHIDIRKGMQLECINCLECVDACTKVMAKQDKPSLVQWTSTKEANGDGKTELFRGKTKMYIAVLALIIGMLFVMGGKKEYMLLNVNKTTELYKVRDDGRVVNKYLLLFQNTQREDYTYDIKIKNNPGIEIKRFKSFKLSHGKLIKKVVVLSTDKKLADDARHDTPITLTMVAFAKEDPKKIVVERQIVFVYPRSDKLKK